MLNEDIDDSEIWRNYSGTETLILGTRASPLYLRIYDKKNELDSAKQEISSLFKRNYLLDNGFKTDHWWNIEFSLRTEVLKQFGAYNLDKLFSLSDSIFKNLMLKNTFLGFDMENINQHISFIKMVSIVVIYKFV